MKRLPEMLMDADASALIGRSVEGLVDEFSMTENHECDMLLMAETRALEAMVRTRATLALAPTPEREIAIRLMPALASTLPTTASVDLVTRLARDWLAGLGDVRRFAGRVHERRVGIMDEMKAAADCASVTHAVIDQAAALRAELSDLEDSASGRVPLGRWAAATFRVQDASTLATEISIAGRAPVIVTIVDLDEDSDRDDAKAPEPELAA